jgi:hypothetical protein
VANFGQVTVSKGAALLVQQGSGPVLLNNTDANNTVWLSGDPFDVVPGDTSTTAPLPPLASVAFDGSASVYGACPAGQSAVISIYPGGGNFFQLVELLVKTLLISGAAGNGLFAYSAAPALGDLIASISAVPTTDPEGNNVGAGILSMVPNGSGGWANFSALSGGVVQIGTSSEVGLLELQGAQDIGYTNVNSGESLLVLGRAQGGVQLLLGVFVGTDPSNGNPETWHNITLDAGWSVGTSAPQYRMTAEGDVELRGVATHASFTAVTALNSSNPLPVAYRPAATRFYRASDPMDTCGMAEMGTNGVILIRANASFPATQGILDGFYSL